jgi:hypothetical protein
MIFTGNLFQVSYLSIFVRAKKVETTSKGMWDDMVKFWNDGIEIGANSSIL